MPFERTWIPLTTTRLNENTPLTLGFEIGCGPGNWNSVPVRVYASPEAGIEATVETLALDDYVNIRRCFADQAGYEEAVPELATYVGRESYGREVVAYMRSLAAAKEDEMTPAERELLLLVATVLAGRDSSADYESEEDGLPNLRMLAANDILTLRGLAKHPGRSRRPGGTGGAAHRGRSAVKLSLGVVVIGVVLVTLRGPLQEVAAGLADGPLLLAAA